MVATSEEGSRLRSPNEQFKARAMNGGSGHGPGPTKDYLMLEEQMLRERLGMLRRKTAENYEVIRAQEELVAS